MKLKFYILNAALLAALSPCLVHAHGFAGDRFFPATLTLEDPFVADELSLPTYSTIVEPGEDGEPATRSHELSTEISKRITSNWQVSFGADFDFEKTPGEPLNNGFNNLEVGTKYQLFKNDAHEAVASIALDWEIGGTGSKRIGADSYSTLSPALYFGKGLGDLPDAVWFLRPLAVTGSFDLAIPLRANNKLISFDEISGEEEIEVENNPDVFEWGLAVEYSLIYLQEHVKDLGIPEPFSRLVPLVEFPVQNPLDRGQAGKITGTVNPGILWSGKSSQVGVEAVIPLTARTGNNIGVIAQLHFYLDDIFPNIFKPIFGGN